MPRDRLEVELKGCFQVALEDYSRVEEYSSSSFLQIFSPEYRLYPSLPKASDTPLQKQLHTLDLQLSRILLFQQEIPYADCFLGKLFYCLYSFQEHARLIQNNIRVLPTQKMQTLLGASSQIRLLFLEHSIPTHLLSLQTLLQDYYLLCHQVHYFQKHSLDHTMRCHAVYLHPHYRL